MAVPGLCAKPIVDMLLVVEDSVDEPSYVPALEAAGYKLLVREPDWFEHRFHDWLRANEVDREEYTAAKRSLAKKKWRHVQHYADAKTQIVREILEWAKR